MSDLYLNPTKDGGNLIIENGKPQMISGLENAVYLSLFTAPWWGNAVSEQSEKYISSIPEIMNAGILTLQVKLDVIEAVKNALAWMIDDGIADRIEVRAEIPQAGTLYLAVTIYEPESADGVDYRYALNWAAQEVSLR